MLGPKYPVRWVGPGDLAAPSPHMRSLVRGPRCPFKPFKVVETTQRGGLHGLKGPLKITIGAATPATQLILGGSTGPLPTAAWYAGGPFGPFGPNIHSYMVSHAMDLVLL